MKRMIPLALCVATVIASGCASPSQPNSPAPADKPATVTSLEGSWHGREMTPGQQGPATLTISGHTLDFHGTDANDWVKGTFTLQEDASPKHLSGLITDCAGQDTIGKKIHAIYKIEDGTLTIAGNSPDDADFPSSFDASGSRQFVFKHDQ